MLKSGFYRRLMLAVIALAVVGIFVLTWSVFRRQSPSGPRVEYAEPTTGWSPPPATIVAQDDNRKEIPRPPSVAQTAPAGLATQILSRKELFPLAELKPGMSAQELTTKYPDAQSMLGDELDAKGKAKSLLHVPVKTGELWHSAVAYVYDGKVEAITYTRIKDMDVGRTNVPSIVKALRKEYGDRFERKVTMLSGHKEHIPSPLLVWKGTDGTAIAFAFQPFDVSDVDTPAYFSKLMLVRNSDVLSAVTPIESPAPEGDVTEAYKSVLDLLK